MYTARENILSITEKIREHIEKYDRLIHQFDMKVVDVRPGRSIVSMEVGTEHLNAAGLCHGAVIFSLADVAFALAANSHGDMALALEISINYLRPAAEGYDLTARAEEIYRGRKTGLYSIRVTDSEGRKIAYLKATAFRMAGRSVTGEDYGDLQDQDLSLFQ